MDMIFDSIVIVRARAYVRLAFKDEKGFWHTIPLDIAAC